MSSNEKLKTRMKYFTHWYMALSLANNLLSKNHEYLMINTESHNASGKHIHEIREEKYA